MAIKGVLFDKDGTLIDDVGTWIPSYREILGELFPDEAEAKFVAAGFDPASNEFVSGSPVAGGTTRDIAAVFWPGVTGAALDEKVRLIDFDYRHVPLKHLKPLMPLEPVLGRLKTMGLRLGIATNDVQHSTRAHVEQLGIAHFFDALMTADSVARPKPAGDMIFDFARRTGLAPAEIAMVGDNPQDMMAARNGGAGLAIAVLTGASSLGDIAHLADHVLESVADLPQLLERL
jgi:phosphoglycolate phosphatase